MNKTNLDNIKEVKILKIKIITLSDRASKGEYEDRSGPLIKEYLENHFQNRGWKYEIESIIISDDADILKEQLYKTKKDQIDIIFTTGGTGIGPRDITPEVVKSLLDKEIPGIMEMIRVKYGQKIPNAVLSRSIAGVIGNGLIYSLPGSVKAVRDYMTEILLTLEHLIYMKHGIDAH